MIHIIVIWIYRRYMREIKSIFNRFLFSSGSWLQNAGAFLSIYLFIFCCCLVTYPRLFHFYSHIFSITSKGPKYLHTSFLYRTKKLTNICSHCPNWNPFFNLFLRYWVKVLHHSPFLKNTSKIMSNASKNPRRKAVLKSLTRPKGKRQRVTMTSLQRICSPLRPTGIMLEKKNIPYLGTL